MPPIYVLDGVGRAFCVDTPSVEAWRTERSAFATSVPRSTSDSAERVVETVENPDSPIHLYAATDEALSAAPQVVAAEARRRRLPIPISGGWVV